MSAPISIQSKKHFLQWFISHYNVKVQEINWFLEDLLVDERALQNVHFVSDTEYCPKGIIISTLEEDRNFLFFKGNVRTNDVYTAYHELHLYHEEAFYIQINFPEKNSHPLYKAVIEEELMQLEIDKQYAESLLNELLVKGKVKYLLQEINKALDHKDNDKFFRYSSELKDFYKNMDNNF
ncbi:YpiB family protein [Pseudogracilibacillus sp. SO30301A]|uniref:YpiB family protein n=1 Tax=Pseudogracilibacillus sp. SO30301A TaxID=3098291 RepID=UPI00300DDFF2